MFSPKLPQNNTTIRVNDDNDNDIDDNDGIVGLFEDKGVGVVDDDDEDGNVEVVDNDNANVEIDKDEGCDIVDDDDDVIVGDVDVEMVDKIEAFSSISLSFTFVATG